MMNMKISDNVQLIKIACDDLKAIRSLLFSTEERLLCGQEKESLAVLGRAISSVISDLEEATSAIDEELKSE